MALCDGRKLRNVHHIHHRVGRSLHINSLCVVLNIRLDVFPRAVNSGKADTVFGGYMVKKTNAASVKIGINDQMISRRKQLHQHGNCCHTTGKRQRVHTVFEGCHHLLQMFSGRILQSAVIKAGTLSNCRMRVSRGLIDRIADRSEMLNGSLIFFQMNTLCLNLSFHMLFCISYLFDRFIITDSAGFVNTC